MKLLHILEWIGLGVVGLWLAICLVVGFMLREYCTRDTWKDFILWPIAPLFWLYWYIRDGSPKKRDAELMKNLPEEERRAIGDVLHLREDERE